MRPFDFILEERPGESVRWTISADGGTRLRDVALSIAGTIIIERSISFREARAFSAATAARLLLSGSSRLAASATRIPPTARSDGGATRNCHSGQLVRCLLHLAIPMIKSASKLRNPK